MNFLVSSEEAGVPRVRGSGGRVRVPPKMPGPLQLGGIHGLLQSLLVHGRPMVVASAPSSSVMAIALDDIVGAAVIVPKFCAVGGVANTERQGAVFLQEIAPQNEGEFVRKAIARACHIRSGCLKTKEMLRQCCCWLSTTTHWPSMNHTTSLELIMKYSG